MTAALRKVQAERQSRDQDEIIARARRHLRTFGRRLRSEILETVGDGRRSIEQVFDDANDELAVLLTAGLINGHLSGWSRAILLARQRTGARRRPHSPSPTALATPFDTAIKFLTTRIDLTVAQKRQLQTMYSREAAEVVADATQVAESKVRRAVRQAAAQTMSRDRAIGHVRQAMDSAGLKSINPALPEQIFRTQTNLAYNAGFGNAMDDPAIDEILWGYEYHTVGDDRVRPKHVGMNGMRAAKADPIWQTHRPPNGYNCRCALIPIWKDDPEHLKSTKRYPSSRIVDGKHTVTGPDKGFTFDPKALHLDVISVSKQRLTVAKPKPPVPTKVPPPPPPKKPIGISEVRRRRLQSMKYKDARADLADADELMGNLINDIWVEHTPKILDAQDKASVMLADYRKKNAINNKARVAKNVWWDNESARLKKELGRLVPVDWERLPKEILVAQEKALADAQAAYQLMVDAADAVKAAKLAQNKEVWSLIEAPVNQRGIMKSKPAVLPDTAKTKQWQTILSKQGEAEDWITRMVDTRGTNGVPGSRLCEPVTVNRLREGGRAYHKSGDVFLEVDDTVSLFVHESVHAIDYNINRRFNRWNDRNEDFLRSRWKGPVIKLKDEFPNSKYKDWEVFIGGDFIDPYVGKIYGPVNKAKVGKDSVGPIRSSEVGTMGMQHLHEDAVKFYQQDRDHFFHIVHLLKGDI